MSLLVIATLVLGIGINSAVFAVVNAVLIRPLPFSDPDRVAVIVTKSYQSSGLGISYPAFLDWKKQSHSFEMMVALRFLSINLTGNGTPEHLTGLRTSVSFFKVVGMPPVKGRDFTEDDDRPGANRTVIISHGLWERRFGADPAIIGKSLVLNDQPYTVIGVAPASRFSLFLYDVWVPTRLFLDEGMMNRTNRYDAVIGKLNPSVTVEQAQAEMDAITHRLAEEYPQSDKDIQADVMSVSRMFTKSGRPLKLIWCASSLVLLLACINVVTVFVANAVERRQELSVRLALGASRVVLLRQFFVQGIVFAGIGGAIGLVVARAAVVFMVNRFPNAVSRLQETNMDSSVVLFTLATTLGTSLLSCVLPSLYTAKLNINSELKKD